LAHLVALRRRRIEACVDLEFFARSSAALAFLSGAPCRVGFHATWGDGPYRGDLLTHRVSYNPHLHTSDAFASLAHALDVEPATLPTLPFVPEEAEPLPSFTPAADETQRVSERLTELGTVANRRLILLNANAGDLLPQRKWAGVN